MRNRVTGALTSMTLAACVSVWAGAARAAGVSPATTTGTTTTTPTVTTPTPTTTTSTTTLTTTPPTTATTTTTTVTTPTTTTSTTTGASLTTPSSTTTGSTTTTSPAKKAKTTKHRPHARHRTVHHSAADGGATVSSASTATASTSTATAAASAALTTTSLSIGDGAATARDIALSRLSAVLAQSNRPPSYLIPIYKAAGRRYDVPWTVLAAINAVETNYGQDLDTSSAGAEGWMQFMPGTWAKYALTKQADPDNPRDAIFAAARYLHASGATGHLRRAIFSYNHATWYVDEVQWLSDEVAAQQHTTHGQRAKLTLMLSTARLLNGLPYVYGGGHSGWTLTTGYDCSGFVSAILHAAGYLTEPVTTQTLPSQPGIQRGPGRWVTIFDRTDAGSLTQDHVIVEIDGQWWESGGSSTAGGGASVHRIRNISPSYLATFNLILHPRSL